MDGLRIIPLMYPRLEHSLRRRVTLARHPLYLRVLCVLFEYSLNRFQALLLTD